MAVATKHTSPINVDHRKALDIRAGDTVRVWTKVEEKGKTRLQAFEGLVLARKHGSEPGATFTVRKVSSGVGIERIFPLYSPNIDKIELVRRAKTRRAKLYYIREKAAKEIRKKMKALHMELPSFLEEESPKEEKKEEKEEEAKNEAASENTSPEEQKADEKKEEAGTDGESPEEKKDNK